MNSILDRFLLAKPVRVVEFPMLVGLGHWDVTALSASSLPHYIHRCAHMANKHAHKPAKKLKESLGIYSKIKTPCYLILIYFGLCTRLGNSLIFIPAIIFTTLTISANQRGEALLEKFGKDHEDYQKRVRWRFIPEVFLKGDVAWTSSSTNRL